MEIITIDNVNYEVDYGSVYAIFTGGVLIGEGRLNLHSKDDVDVYIRFPYNSQFDVLVWPKLKDELLKRLRNKLGQS